MEKNLIRKEMKKKLITYQLLINNKEISKKDFYFSVKNLFQPEIDKAIEIQRELNSQERSKQISDELDKILDQEFDEYSKLHSDDSDDSKLK